MPSTGTEFTTTSLLIFIFLGIIRGTFSVAIHFSVKSYRFASLVFLLRTPGSIALYVVMILVWSYRSDEMKRTFLTNFKNIRNYWKLAVMGLVQLAAPYMLFMQGLKVLSPTVGGVFMAAAPWATILLERLPFVRVKTSLNSIKILALCIGGVGVILVSAADTLFSVKHAHYRCDWVRPYNSSNSTDSALVCRYYTSSDAIIALLSLTGGCLMWAISSVFWRSYKGDIHYVTSGVWNNLFGGMYAAIIWTITWPFGDSDEVHWSNDNAAFSIIFLTVLSGWLAAVMVDYMYRTVGPAATNRVLCLVPVVTWLEDWLLVRRFTKTYSEPVYINIVEVTGIVLVFVGLVLSSIEQGTTQNPLQQPLLDSGQYETDPARDRSQADHDQEDRGAHSEEEVMNNRGRQTDEEHGYQFPPLVEYKPEESSHD